MQCFFASCRNYRNSSCDVLLEPGMIRFYSDTIKAEIGRGHVVQAGALESSPRTSYELHEDVNALFKVKSGNYGNYCRSNRMHLHDELIIEGTMNEMKFVNFCSAFLSAAPMECVAESSGAHQRELFARQALFNHITVSKKRNWLQQSAARPFPQAEDVTAPPAAEEDHAEEPPRPRRLPLPAGLKPARVVHHRTDPAEENDADDEGEIWYNPIPEDDEAVCVPAIRVSQTGPVTDGDGAVSPPGERATQGENLAVRATGTGSETYRHFLRICSL